MVRARGWAVTGVPAGQSVESLEDVKNPIRSAEPGDAVGSGKDDAGRGWNVRVRRSQVTRDIRRRDDERAGRRGGDHRGHGMMSLIRLVHQR